MNSSMYAVLVVILALLFIMVVASINTPPQQEGLSGFGVTSALNAYNRSYYSDPGDGDAYAGGTYLVGRVVF